MKIIDNDNGNDDDVDEIEWLAIMTYDDSYPTHQVFEVDEALFEYIMNNFVNGNNEEINDEDFYISPNLASFINISNNFH